MAIQIHLMFLFIQEARKMLDKGEDSNTSHVLIYHRCPLCKVGMPGHSNTSHVLIYLLVCADTNAESIFKYISCSYLSIPKIWLSAYLRYSNTSHVLIYPTFFQRFCILLYSSTSHFSSIFFYFYQVHCIFSLYLIFHLELLIFMVSQTF